MKVLSQTPNREKKNPFSCFCLVIARQNMSLIWQLKLFSSPFYSFVEKSLKIENNFQEFSITIIPQGMSKWIFNITHIYMIA